MGDSALTERYLLLGLRLGRHVDGLVDAYFGSPELAAHVDAEAPAEPRALVAEAETLVDELSDGWLRDQVVGLHTFARALAGHTISYEDEVAGCYGIRPPFTDESVFEAAHRRLDSLLPGTGSLVDRHDRWEASMRVPADDVGRILTAVVDEARIWTRRLVELPNGEGVDVQAVHDVPWIAFCEYLGGLRSEISVNVDLPLSAIELLRVALHETYPGHHAERCLKEHVLVRGKGRLEETIVLVPTPQSLVSEGIAVLAPGQLLRGDGGEALAAVVRDAGIELDLARALAIDDASRPLRWAEVNASLMLHAHGHGAEEVRDYVRRWGLLSEELSAHLIRFLTESTSRTYLITYAAGADLCRAYVRGDSERFRTLLTEQMRVRDLVAAARDADPDEFLGAVRS